MSPFMKQKIFWDEVISLQNSSFLEREAGTNPASICKEGDNDAQDDFLTDVARSRACRQTAGSSSGRV